MAETPTPETALRPYMVSLAFLSGPLFINAIMAPSPESATAMFSVMIMREYAVPQPLTGCAATELTAEFLRTALRAAEGKLPPNGEAQVLSLVPSGGESGVFHGRSDLPPLDDIVHATAPTQDDPPPDPPPAA